MTTNLVLVVDDGTLQQSLQEEGNGDAPADLSKLGVDVHSHFIPGIDDGAQTLAKRWSLRQRGGTGLSQGDHYSA
ncbi:MAG: hypothetical protein IPO05_02875 [Flavobacteriales bacterium]|nr:hypothetical protein [Flavobacteriales bacterium]